METLQRQFKADQDLLVPLVTDLKAECATDTFPRIFPVNRNLWGELKSLLLSNAVASHWLHSREWQSLSSFQPARLAPLAQSFNPVFSAVNDIHQERKGQVLRNSFAFKIKKCSFYPLTRVPMAC